MKTENSRFWNTRKLQRESASKPFGEDSSVTMGVNLMMCFLIMWHHSAWTKTDNYLQYLKRFRASMTLIKTQINTNLVIDKEQATKYWRNNGVGVFYLKNKRGVTGNREGGVCWWISCLEKKNGALGGMVFPSCSFDLRCVPQSDQTHDIWVAGLLVRPKLLGPSQCWHSMSRLKFVDVA